MLTKKKKINLVSRYQQSRFGRQKTKKKGKRGRPRTVNKLEMKEEDLSLSEEANVSKQSESTLRQANGDLDENLTKVCANFCSVFIYFFLLYPTTYSKEKYCDRFILNVYGKHMFGGVPVSREIYKISYLF